MAAILEHNWNVREMHKADLDRIMELEGASYPFPWTRGIFADCLRVGYLCRVAEFGGRVVAYSVLSVAAGEAHLLNLCVSPEVRRQGVGSMLLERVVGEAVLNGAERLFLEVRPSNAGALRMYRASGFRVVGRRPGYYPAAAGREDAVVMVRRLHVGGQ